jgi:hypothetical protein
MMDVPLKIQIQVILNEIKEWSIIWFQDNSLQYPSPHWYIIVPTSDPSYFFLNMITSQREERFEYYRRTRQSKAAKCLVNVGNNEFPFLKPHITSVIDCNQSAHLSIEEIIHRVDEPTGFNYCKEEKVPSYLKKDIISSIVHSPLIRPAIQEIAKKTNQP